MSGYPLGPLLRIRKSRERTAAARAAAARQRLDETGRVLQQRRDELAAYGPWRTQRETELFAAIKNQLINVSRIDAMKAEMAEMASREHHLEELVLLAEKERNDAQAALDQARGDHARALREERKIQEHHENWRTRQRLAAEQALEREQEDVARGPAGPAPHAHFATPLAQAHETDHEHLP